MTKPLPIRLRLTIWYTSLTLAVLLTFSIAVYVGLDRRLSSQLDEDLQSQAALAAEAITLGSEGPAFSTQIRFTDEALIRVVNLDGQVLRAFRGTEDLSSSPPQASAIERASDGRSSLDTVRYDGRKLRVITVPIVVNNVVAGALQVGYSMSRVEAPLKFMLQALLIIAPIAVLIAGCTGYMLAGNALRPVSRITKLASRIDEDDLDSRLKLHLPDDEIGRLASTFDSMLDRIADAFQRQRQFTGDAAHELRTPLALMRSQIDLAVTQADTTDEFREALNALDGDVGRMTTLVSTLLSLARADAGQLAPNLESVDLAEIAGDVADQLQPLAGDNGLTIITVLDPVTAQVDADMIIQVLVNLIDNAIKNTADGGTITVQTGEKASDPGNRDGIPANWPRPFSRLGEQADVAGASTPSGSHIPFLSVSDSGIGIAPDHLPRIFDRFYRVDSGRARTRGGIGLGLAICQAIAHAHGGTIVATSENGQGSTFTLTLPAR